MTPARIKEIRKELRLTQAQLAAVLGLDVRSVRRFEAPEGTTNHRKPGGPVQKMLEAFLNGYRPDNWPNNGQ